MLSIALRKSLAAFTVAILAVTLAGCYKPSSEPKYKLAVTSDVVYGHGETAYGTVPLKLDIYQPEVPGQSTFPLMVLIHGGAFLTGDKTQIASYARQYASHGYLVAAVDYRLAGQIPVVSERFKPALEVINNGTQGPVTSFMTSALAAIEDVTIATEYLHTLPQVNKNETVLNGESAGAIIAVHMAYVLDEYGIKHPPVAAVLSHFGGMYPPLSNPSMIGIDRMGIVAGEYTKPPLYMAHATGDYVVPYEKSASMAKHAQQTGFPHKLVTVDANVHVIDINKFEASPGVTIFDDEIAWLNNRLVGTPTDQPNRS